LGGCIIFHAPVFIPVMKIVSGILIALLIAAITVLIIQQQSQVKLRQENESLRQQLDQLTRLQADNEQLSNRLAQASATADGQTQELLKLRSEVGTLHQHNDKIADLQKKNQQLSTALTSSRNVPTASSPPQTAPKTTAPENTTAASDTIDQPDLGAVQLINQTPSQFDLGNGKICTLTPAIGADGNYNIKVLFESQKSDGTAEQHTAEIITAPGRAVRIAVGDSSIGFTPTVSPVP